MNSIDTNLIFFVDFGMERERNKEREKEKERERERDKLKHDYCYRRIQHTRVLIRISNRNVDLLNLNVKMQKL